MSDTKTSIKSSLAGLFVGKESIGSCIAEHPRMFIFNFLSAIISAILLSVWGQWSLVKSYLLPLFFFTLISLFPVIKASGGDACPNFPGWGHFLAFAPLLFALILLVVKVRTIIWKGSEEEGVFDAGMKTYKAVKEEEEEAKEEEEEEAKAKED